VVRSGTRMGNTAMVAGPSSRTAQLQLHAAEEGVGVYSSSLGGLGSLGDMQQSKRAAAHQATRQGKARHHKAAASSSMATVRCKREDEFLRVASEGNMGPVAWVARGCSSDMRHWHRRCTGAVRTALEDVVVADMWVIGPF
jgi:CO dehydrogenase nickel-insertion accessory protein CooC1